ncbi:MAG: hypothetical protein ACXVCP_18045 [Bdellovibrio sp.]
MKKIFALLLILAGSSVHAHPSIGTQTKFIGKKIIMQSKIPPVMIDDSTGMAGIGHAIYFNEINSDSDCNMRFDRYYNLDEVGDRSIPAGTEFIITDAQTYLSENAWGFPTSGTMIEFNTRSKSLKGQLPKEQARGEMLYISCDGNPEISEVAAKARIKSVEKALKIMSRKYNFVVQ